MTWVEEIVEAFRQLGGSASYDQLYDYFRANARRQLPASWQEIIRARIEERSSDSQAFKGEEDLFYSVEGIGAGVWGLRDVDPNWVKLQDEVPDSEDYWEGNVRRIPVNIHERNRSARARCIGHYGTRCLVCGFDFGEMYGAIGRGFIHVHHLVPLSQTNERYRLDPIRDLRPVCPNCHEMLHIQEPPYGLEDLASRLTPR